MKIEQKTQQYFTHSNATRVRPEALAERYENSTCQSENFKKQEVRVLWEK